MDRKGRKRREKKKDEEERKEEGREKEREERGKEEETKPRDEGTALARGKWWGAEELARTRGASRGRGGKRR